MHRLLDDYAHDNRLRGVSPKLKLLVGTCSILICIASPTFAVPLLVATSLSFALIGMAGIPLGFYARLLAVPLSFALLSSSVVALLSPGETIASFGFLTLTDDGLRLGVLLVSRTIGGMASLFFIALTTPMIEIFSILRSLRIPEALVELSMLIYRYIFVLLEEAMAIYSAQEMRMGYSSTRRSIGSFAMLASVLFLRAWERGERLMVAMDSRCYNGRMALVEEHFIKPIHLTAALIYLMFMTMLLAFEIGGGPS